MPKARTIEMHFHAITMGIVGNGLYLALGHYGAIEGVLESNDLCRATGAGYEFIDNE
jgi:hypothetical protein